MSGEVPADIQQRIAESAITAAVVTEQATLGDRLSALPRWMHRAYAAMCGYFWLPCPLCGREFGGHEWRDANGMSSSIVVSSPDDEARGLQRRSGICPECTRAGRGDGPAAVLVIPTGEETPDA